MSSADNFPRPRGVPAASKHVPFRSEIPDRWEFEPSSNDELPFVARRDTGERLEAAFLVDLQRAVLCAEHDLAALTFDTPPEEE